MKGNPYGSQLKDEFEEFMGILNSDKQFTRADMKAFGDRCRIVMNGKYSENAMNALLDTWIENRQK